LVLPIMRGASVFYLCKRPSLDTLHLDLQKVKPTVILVVPHLVEKLFRNIVYPRILSSRIMAKYYKIPFIRRIINWISSKAFFEYFGNHIQFMGIGGGNVSPDVELFLSDSSFPYTVGYGITEASTLLSGSKPFEVRIGCVGVALPGQEIKIHNPIDSGGEGEIWVRGANIMSGYYKDKQLTNEVITDDGWLRTGDKGFIHSDGYLELRGRLNPEPITEMNIPINQDYQNFKENNPISINQK
jgi:long-chain acyl-CoA synthetase